MKIPSNAFTLPMWKRQIGDRHIGDTAILPQLSPCTSHDLASRISVSCFIFLVSYVLQGQSFSRVQPCFSGMQSVYNLCYYCCHSKYDTGNKRNKSTLACDLFFKLQSCFHSNFVKYQLLKEFKLKKKQKTTEHLSL